MSQKDIQTLQISILPKILASSYFLLRHQLFPPCRDSVTSVMSQKDIQTLQISILPKILASSYFLNRIKIYFVK